MAGCYHDTQDFKSDLKIEVARECDILEAGEDIKDIECDKNPGHEGFIPFKDLTMEHLPIEDRNTELFDFIKKIGSGVVRLVVEKGERKMELGSGCVYKWGNTYFIKTNNHVVKTDDDVKHCTVEFHYDDFNDEKSVFTSRGVELATTNPYRDITLFTIDPVPDFLHQLDWMYDRIPSIVILESYQKITEKKTYPRTMYKESQLEYYDDQNLNSSLINLMFISWPDNSISYLKSSYFKFQPIPSNIQELTSIEIHIYYEDDDDNSRVIPGDVVKFGDEFVVKISESIFQDEVKKCRLVWNGEDIGRGTRLYFQPVKSSDIFRDIDLEPEIELGRDYWWVFEFYPMIKYEKINPLQKPSPYCYCIGHPHGGIKMVTFGRLVDVSPEKFDNQLRRITQPNSDCQCKEVNCIKYSCKTCPGSSGSPVFDMSEFTDIGYGYCHFMGGKEKRVLSNHEQIYNINMAWAGNARIKELQGK